MFAGLNFKIANTCAVSKALYFEFLKQVFAFWFVFLHEPFGDPIYQKTRSDVAERIKTHASKALFKLVAYAFAVF